jgi:membrane protein required for colicin V production
MTARIRPPFRCLPCPNPSAHAHQFRRRVVYEISRMNGVDYLIIAVLLISTFLGMARGFVREAIALIAWLGGVWLAWRFAPLVTPFLSGALDDVPNVKIWVARLIILIGVLLASWLVASVISYLLQYSGVTVVVDRLLGMLFGVLRGGVIVSIVVILGQFVRLDRAGWWQRSTLMPAAVEVASYVRVFAETGMQSALSETNQS